MPFVKEIGGAFTHASYAHRSYTGRDDFASAKPKRGRRKYQRGTAFMRVWAWIAIGVALVTLAVLLFPLVEIQRDLRLANEQGVQAKARIAELERAVANLETDGQKIMQHTTEVIREAARTITAQAQSGSPRS
jgi:cell division protein FtsB